MSKRNSCTSLRPTENCGWTSVAELWAQQGREPQGPSSPRARPLGVAAGWPQRDGRGPAVRAKEGHRSLLPAPPSSSSSSSSFSSSSAGDQSRLAGSSSRSRRFSVFQISAGNEAGMPRRGSNVVRVARPRPEPQEVGGERRCRRTTLANSF